VLVVCLSPYSSKESVLTNRLSHRQEHMDIFLKMSMTKSFAHRYYYSSEVDISLELGFRFGHLCTLDVTCRGFLGRVIVQMSRWSL
jgi:hypothetical protein